MWQMQSICWQHTYKGSTQLASYLDFLFLIWAVPSKPCEQLSRRCWESPHVDRRTCSYQYLSNLTKITTNTEMAKLSAPGHWLVFFCVCFSVLFSVSAFRFLFVSNPLVEAESPHSGLPSATAGFLPPPIPRQLTDRHRSPRKGPGRRRWGLLNSPSFFIWENHVQFEE